MEKIELLDEKIKNLSTEQIIPVKPGRAVPVVLCIAGAVLLILGSIRVIDQSTVNLLLIVAGIILLLFGLISVMRTFGKDSYYYIYEPSGKKIKKHKIYLNPDDMPKLSRALEDRNFNGLKSIAKEPNAKEMLVVMAPDDASVLLAQTFEYIPYNYEPTSQVYILKGNDARQIWEFTVS